MVFTKAKPAEALAARALPPLKPNQPNQRRAAPRRARGTLWGRMAWRPKSFLGPRTKAPTRAAMPALMCTTVPPAKSRAPQDPKNPPPQTQWARGA